MCDLFRIEKVSWKFQEQEEKDKMIPIRAKYAYQAIVWYISTGRASLDFENALNNLTLTRIHTMINKMINGDTTDQGMIKTAKKYLKLGE